MLLRYLVIAWLLAAFSGCSGSAQNESGSCASDAECTAPGTRCDLARSLCVCLDDRACDRNSFCNVAGICQRRRGCATNGDCGEGTFCDIDSGLCLQQAAQPTLGSACGLASHCPFGTVCQEGQCIEGCFDNGDCPLGQACLDGFCFSGRPGEPICTSSDFCEFGDVCGTDNVCRRDQRGPYCRGCTQRTAANPNPCDGFRNFCLLNSQELGGFTSFCGVDCSEPNQPCPSGYSCSDVIVLTRSTCGSTADCRCQRDQIAFARATCQIAQPCVPRLPNGQPDPNASACRVEGAAACNGGTAGGPASCIVPRDQTNGNCTCATDADCRGMGTCVGGLCCTGPIRPEADLECAGGEGRVTGFCTCATDADCGRDSCDPISRSCTITGVSCTPGANDCPPIACIDGGCFIGRNCAPEQGLSCSVVGGR